MHHHNSIKEGEPIKMSGMFMHPSYSELINDFIVLKLEKFAPVQLAAADDTELNLGDWASVLSWEVHKAKYQA